MTRTRGVTLQREFARWLQQWWPFAESTGSGRQGCDVENTPGVAWEVKTAGADNLRPAQWVAQAARNADGNLHPVVWFPPGVGMGSPMKAVVVFSLPQAMRLLELAEVAPPRREEA